MHLRRDLIVHFLLFNYAVLSTSFSLLDKISSEKNKILEGFFVTKIFQNNVIPRLFTILGASRDQLDRTKFILEYSPRLIAKDGEKICTSKEFTPKTFVLQFLSNFEEGYVNKVVENLIRCSRHNFIYFVYEGTAVTIRDIEFVLRLAFEKLTKVPIFLNCRKTFANMYGYGVVEGCTKATKLLSRWIPGVQDNDTISVRWVTDYKREACPITIAVINSLPWIKLEKDSNGAMKIIGGFDGQFVLTIAQKLNITSQMEIWTIPVEDPNYKMTQLVESCASGNVTIGIAHLRPTESIMNLVDVSRTYRPECVVWCVPRITRWATNIMVSEFSRSTWFFVGLTFVASFAVEKVVRNFYQSNRGDSGKSESSYIIIDLVALILGNPIVYESLNVGRNVLLFSYLLYSTVLTTAYKTSLASLFTVESGESIIFSPNKIIEENLTPGGDMFGLQVLEDQKELHSFIPALINRYEIINSSIRALRRVSNDRDFAYLTTLSNLNYQMKVLAKTGEPLKFDVLNRCALMYNPVIILPRISRFLPQIDTLRQHLNEGGFISHWQQHYFGQRASTAFQQSATSSGTINTNDDLVRFNRQKYFSVLIFYCAAMVVCGLVFMGEIVAHKLLPSRKVKRFDDLIRLKIGRSLLR